MARIEIRAAVDEDAEALAAVHVAAWREAYIHLLSTEFLANLTVESRRGLWRRLLADPSAGSLIAVDPLAVPDDGPRASCGGKAVGFAGTRPGRDGPRGLELWGIYLLRRWHGKGVGQRLLDASVGERPCFLWVAEDNPRAHAFYRRNGFRPDGGRQVEPAWENLVSVRMVR